MSKAKELLLECKIKLGIKTDYKLAQFLEINRARIHAYANEKENPDAYTCTRIALILQRNPTEIIALIQEETEKNPKKREFWQKFILSAKKAVTNIYRGEERRKSNA